MKHKRWTILLLLGILLGLTSLLITLYPLLSNYISEKNKSNILTEYADTVEGMEDDSILELLAETQAYNTSLASGVQADENALSRAGQAAAALQYYDLLNIGAGGIMGYVEIPKIAVYLPIYHGTESEVLDMGIGHLIGSSLPVGGESTHAVLTGHSGMARERMFSDLDQLKVGDVFYLHVLDLTLAYEVDQTKIVLPDNTSYLGIEKGEDYCTLVTCTPYAVNTHRLLVRGHRTDYEESEEITEAVTEPEEQVTSTWTKEYIKGILISLFTAAVMTLCMVVFQPLRKRGKHERR